MWPESAGLSNPANSARQRRWIRHRKYMPSNDKDQILIGLLKPGSTIPLPLSGLTQPYILEFRPKNDNDQNEYSWSVVLEKHCLSDFSLELENSDEIYLSMLTESVGLLYCSEISGSSLNNRKGLWFCLNTEATEIGKDLHSNPIHDWNLKLYSPLSITNFLPLSAEYAIVDQLPTEESVACSEDTIVPGETINIYNADPRDPLYLSVLPQGGWQQLHV
ncbi:Vacuolar protein sorting-associated protein 13 [Dioscorea alata]|uniref:Vacuolar protein sorting-associated protein 13 n=1 Tax=Dioscorea alata TaxID=55571 RepID=A0ACB7WHK3_DIOAL|nr:Vacuolar protein sorting-associated protein 13 [Dioscorea alata]